MWFSGADAAFHTSFRARLHVKVLRKDQNWILTDPVVYDVIFSAAVNPDGSVLQVDELIFFSFYLAADLYYAVTKCAWLQ